MIQDRRLLIEESMGGAKAEIRELLEQLVLDREGFSYDIKDLFEVPPTMADRDGPVARCTAAAIRRVLGRDEFICSPGTYDQKHRPHRQLRVHRLRPRHPRPCASTGRICADRGHDDSAKVMALSAFSAARHGMAACDRRRRPYCGALCCSAGRMARNVPSSHVAEPPILDPTQIPLRPFPKSCTAMCFRAVAVAADGSVRHQLARSWDVSSDGLT